MNEQRTTSILQRIPVILAVTAASYGLTQAQVARQSTGANASTSSTSATVAGRNTPAMVR
jgi:hypothetical protein